MAVQSIIQRQFDLQEPLRMISLQHELTSADSKGDIFKIAITDGGKAADLTDMDVAAYFIRADGVTVPITGTASGNVASVTLSSSCYTKPGRFALVIKVTKGSIRHAVFSAEGVVRRSTTDSIVDESNVIPSLDELLAQISAMEKATTAASTAADKANAAADDIEKLQIKASTLPTGSAATASYADGVLTLGLPRGEKGDMGSAGPFTVNNVEGIGDNITITGDNVPLSAADNTALSAAVLQRDRVVSLLGNSYFPSSVVVNQRGWSSGTEVAAGQYFIDRWLAASGGAVTPTLTSNGITATGEFFQIVPKSGLVGKTVTAAIGLSDGTVLAKSGVVPADGTWANLINTSMNSANLLLTNVSEDMLRFRIFCNGNTVRWAALYEGAYTRATLPVFQPKGYVEELLDCQRYYYKVPKHSGITYPGYSGGTTEARATIYVPVVMRVNPSITVEDMTQLKVYDAAGSHDVTAAAINYRDGNAVGIRLTTADLTTSRPCVVRLNTTVALVADFEP